MATAITSRNVWEPFGPFSMGIVQEGGVSVHLKGQVAMEKDGSIVGLGDMRSQTRKVRENLMTTLKTVGGDTADIVSVTNYVTDIAPFMDTRDLRREFFAEPFPVSTTVQVAVLYRPEFLVEISAIVEIPRERFIRPSRR